MKYISSCHVARRGEEKYILFFPFVLVIAYELQDGRRFIEDILLLVSKEKAWEDAKCRWTC